MKGRVRVHVLLCFWVFFWKWKKVQTNESQRREVAAVTITSIRFRTVLSLQGAMSCNTQTQQLREWSVDYQQGWGIMTQQNVTSRLLCMMQDHLTVGRVEAITADFIGWVNDSMAGIVSQNPGTQGWTLCMYVRSLKKTLLPIALNCQVYWTVESAWGNWGFS